MKNVEELNIYDMSEMVEIKNVFYERVGKREKSRYRKMTTVCSDKYTWVTDKAFIKKLHVIFKVAQEIANYEG